MTYKSTHSKQVHTHNIVIMTITTYITYISKISINLDIYENHFFLHTSVPKQLIRF